eukprot:s813_g12.t1
MPTVLGSSGIPGVGPGGQQTLPEVRRAGDDRGTAAADGRSPDDIRRHMENDEVLACFLDLGEDGMKSYKLWSEKLQDVPAFEATCITHNLDGLETLQEQFPLGIQISGCSSCWWVTPETWDLLGGVMTAWCDAPGPTPVHGIEPSTKAEACPKCGDALLPDSKFCRHCGYKLPVPTGFASAAAVVALPEDGTSQDGLQFLCAKYSALITRLREEVLAHQQSQAEARLLERRLRDESQIWAKEKEQLMREQQCLKDEIASLKSQLYGGRQHEHDVNGANRLGMAREPTAANDQLRYQYEAQHKQHQQMMTLLNEHSQLQLEERTAQDELNACRDHLSRWRRKAGDLESKAMEAEQQRNHAEKKVRTGSRWYLGCWEQP